MPPWIVLRVERSEHWQSADYDRRGGPHGYLEEHPEAVAAFLAEYEAHRLCQPAMWGLRPQAGGQLWHPPSAAIAKSAIPQCHLTYIAGGGHGPRHLPATSPSLYQADPTSVGGSLPDDAIYYVP